MHPAPRAVALAVLLALGGLGLAHARTDDALCAPTTFSGEATAADEGAYLLLPFHVAPGVTEIKVRYAWTQPQDVVAAAYRTTLDLGLRDPDGFRGWSGSGKGWPGATLDVRGLASEHGERAVRVGPDWATPSYLAGPLPAGEWFVELGVAALAAGQATTFTVVVECSDAPAGPAFVAPPLPAAPAKAGPAWFAGDFHVHTNHSENPGPLTRVTDAAVARGLDFVAVSDHNTVSAYAEFAAMRERHPGLLLMRSQEVTTYRGHANAHGVGAAQDYRAGPVYRVEPGGARTLVSEGVHANDLFRAVRAAGGLNQINHPSFPTDPVGRNVCRGCGWEFAGTDYSLVDAIEVQTGPAGTTPAILGAPEGFPMRDQRLGPNPLTPPALVFWERALLEGHRVTAVGGSDDHTGGATVDVTHSAVGTPTTVVYADELTEGAILEGVRAGHVFIKFWDANGPDLRLTAQNGAGEEVMMGDAIGGAPDVRVTFFAMNAPLWSSVVLVADGVPVLAAPVGETHTATLTLPFAAPGFYYGMALDANGALLAMTNPVYVEA